MRLCDEATLARRRALNARQWDRRPPAIGARGFSASTGSRVQQLSLHHANLSVPFPHPDSCVTRHPRCAAWLRDTRAGGRQRTCRRSAAARGSATDARRDPRRPRTPTGAGLGLGARALEMGRTRLGLGAWSLDPPASPTDAGADRRTSHRCALAPPLLGSRPLGLALRHLGLVLGLRSLAGLNSRPSPHRLDLRHDVRARISSPDRLPLWLECVSRFTLAVICLSKAPAVTAPMCDGQCTG